MKFLMITQKIDKNDDILGIYHEWARTISKNFEKLSVICLYEGLNELPDNIRVFSLGKEKNNFQVSIFKFQFFKKIKYLWLFYKYIWRERKNYDVVFVHMTPVYVILGWPLWTAMGKKIFLFYAHYRVGMLLRIAALFCKGIITSVPGSCGLRSSKVIAIGQGIDTSRFIRNAETARSENSLLFVGRISPVKNLDVLIDALDILAKEGKKVDLRIVGGRDYGEEKYFSYIQKKVGNYNLDRFIIFAGEVPNSAMTEIYNQHEIVVNLTLTGSFDKTILEAMSCECLPIVSNELYRNVFPKDLHDLLIFKHNDSNKLADNIYKVMTLPREEKIEIGNRMREIVLKGHSLSTLGDRLHKVFKGK